MAQRKLVTGSTGNIGSIVVKHLQAAEHPFVAGAKSPVRDDQALPTLTIRISRGANISTDYIMVVYNGQNPVSINMAYVASKGVLRQTQHIDSNSRFMYSLCIFTYHYRWEIMQPTYTITYEPQPDQTILDPVIQGLRSFNRQQTDTDNNQFQSCYFFLRRVDQTIVGGILAGTYWNYLYIDVLWVDESLRKHGYGRDLLVRAEQEAITRGMQYAYLDTFSFQAPLFYQKHGYTIFGTLPDFPPGHTRYFLTKTLQPPT